MTRSREGPYLCPGAIAGPYCNHYQTRVTSLPGPDLHTILTVPQLPQQCARLKSGVALECCGRDGAFVSDQANGVRALLLASLSLWGSL